MNDAIAAIALGRRIDLTREADFVVGGARIRPTACEVEVAGRRIRLQPRVMQVLVALARAGGEPVSREALIEVCWGSVTVGEDALNRCIQRLRRLAEAEVGGAFAIETIPRIGYRLAPGPQSDDGDIAAHAGTVAPRKGPRRAVIAAAGLLVALLVVAAAWIWIERPAHWSIERSEPLVSTPQVEGQPAISADGTMLAFSSGSHIWLKRLSGGEPIQLTDGPYDDAFPAWSRDGAQVAYTVYHPGEPCRIMVAPVPAGLPREVGRCQTTERSRAIWSAAGDALLFVDAPAKTAPNQIVSLDLATGRRRAITHPPGGVDDIEPAVSPDGRWLLFFRVSFLPEQVSVQNLKTGEVRVLARLPQEHIGAAWAEDSRSVFYVGETAQGYSIWSYPIDGGPRDTLIGMGSPMNLGLMATARGGLLAAEIGRGRLSLVEPPSSGDTPVAVDPANGSTNAPAFAPDGTLAMGSTRQGAGIWLMPPGGRSRMLLSVPDGGIPMSVAWSPDGAELAFVTLGLHTSLTIITAAGEPRAKIFLPGTMVLYPAWSGDGRSVLLPIRDEGGWRIWRVELDGGRAPYPITGYGWVAVGSDRNGLYGVRYDQPGIWRLGPTPQRLTAAFTYAQKQAWAWTVFRGDLVFYDDSDPKLGRLLATPLAGGPTRLFAVLPKQADDKTFAIDPRSGKPVYIQAFDVDTDIELFHLARR